MGPRPEFLEFKPDGICFPDRAKQIIKSVDSETLSMAAIKAVVCAYFGVSGNDLTAHRREQWTIIARHIAIYFCHRLTGKATTQIGRAFCRDHTAILYAKRKIAASKDEDINKYVEELAVIFESWQ